MKKLNIKKDLVEDTNDSNFFGISYLSSFDNKLLDNITVITSDVYDLGKSYKIEKMIEKDKKKYFRLARLLSKTIIFQKLSVSLKEIK